MIINCKKHLTPPNDDNIMNHDIWADSIVIKLFDVVQAWCW